MDLVAEVGDGAGAHAVHAGHVHPRTEELLVDLEAHRDAARVGDGLTWKGTYAHSLLFLIYSFYLNNENLFNTWK